MNSKYLDEFNGYIQEQLVELQPKDNPNLQPGTITRMQSYIIDFYDKLTKLNQVLVAKANQILDRSTGDQAIDRQKLHEELFERGKEAFNEYTAKYKPQ